jgi:hypothetical protein
MDHERDKGTQELSPWNMGMFKSFELAFLKPSFRLFRGVDMCILEMGTWRGAPGSIPMGSPSIANWQIKYS